MGTLTRPAPGRRQYNNHMEISTPQNSKWKSIRLNLDAIKSLDKIKSPGQSYSGIIIQLVGIVESGDKKRMLK